MKEAEGEQSCEKSDKCSKDGCYCQLFMRPQGDEHKDKEWEFVPVNPRGKAKKRSHHDYKCICVKPVLPKEYTLCGCLECVLSDSGEGDLLQYKCEGECPKGCACNLFRIKKPAKDSDHKEKWEHVEKPGKYHIPDKDYYYRCFCVKAAP